MLHTGQNLNGSIFSKEVVDQNIESIKNTPVLGFIQVTPDGTDDFTQHEYRYKKTVNGTEYVYAGNAYGVIPESCNPRWVDKVSHDGVLRTYLQVDAVLWTKFQAATDIFRRDQIKGQSMELELTSIEGNEDANGIFTFTSFLFNGCCILSTSDASIQPAMIDSIAAVKFSAAKIAEQVKQKLEEYSIKIKEDGLKYMSVLGKLPESQYTLNLIEQLDDIEIALNEKKFKDQWGYEGGQYCFADVQGNEVIAYNRADHMRVYGIPYIVDGDKIVLKFDECSRKKTIYADYEESIEPDVDGVENAILQIGAYLAHKLGQSENARTNIEKQYYEVKQELDDVHTKLETYAKMEAQHLEEARNQIITTFEKELSGNADFIALKDISGDLEPEALEEKCYCILGRMKASFTVKPPKDTVRLPVNTIVTKDTPYGGIFDEYGKAD